jgi:hypothetical protein
VRNLRGWPGRPGWRIPPALPQFEDPAGAAGPAGDHRRLAPGVTASGKRLAAARAAPAGKADGSRHCGGLVKFPAAQAGESRHRRDESPGAQPVPASPWHDWRPPAGPGPPPYGTTGRGGRAGWDSDSESALAGVPGGA